MKRRARKKTIWWAISALAGAVLVGVGFLFSMQGEGGLSSRMTDDDKNRPSEENAEGHDKRWTYADLASARPTLRAMVIWYQRRRTESGKWGPPLDIENGPSYQYSCRPPSGAYRIDVYDLPELGRIGVFLGQGQVCGYVLPDQIPEIGVDNDGAFSTLHLATESVSMDVLPDETWLLGGPETVGSGH